MAQLKDTLITGNLSVTGTGNIGGDTQVSGDLTLYQSGTGDSPALVFQRGTLVDNYNDWRLIDVGGQLKFQERGLSSTDWTNRVSMSSAGDVTATTFTGSGANLTGVVKSVTASGILSSSGGTTPAITHNAPATSPAKSTSAVYPITIDSYGHITAVGTAVTIPTVTSSYSSTGTDAVNGTAVNAALQTLDSSITATTGQAISAITITDGKIASSSKISVGDANQNAFSNIKVGSTTIAADSTTDTLELVAGTDITLTPDETNDKITIAFSGSSGGSYTATSPIEIDSSDNISHATSGVTAGTYLPEYNSKSIGYYFPTLTVDSTGHITSASNYGKGITTAINSSMDDAVGFMKYSEAFNLSSCLDFLFPHIYTNNFGLGFTIAAGSSSATVNMAVGYNQINSTSIPYTTQPFLSPTLYSYRIVGVDAILYSSTTKYEPVIVDWTSTDVSYNSTGWTCTVTVSTADPVPTGYTLYFKILYSPYVSM